MSAGSGTPGEEHPARAARDLGLNVPGGPVTWADLLNAAVESYWQNRTPISRKELAAWKRERNRDRLTPQQWQRRAGAA